MGNAYFCASSSQKMMKFCPFYLPIQNKIHFVLDKIYLSMQIGMYLISKTKLISKYRQFLIYVNADYIQIFEVL